MLQRNKGDSFSYFFNTLTDSHVGELPLFDQQLTKQVNWDSETVNQRLTNSTETFNQLLTLCLFFRISPDGEPRSQADVITNCRQRRTCLVRSLKPIGIGIVIVTSVLALTMVVLKWNYNETRNRLLTRRQDIILDHWGKGQDKQGV